MAPDFTTNGPYSPGDLFLEEPPGSGHYIIQARKDDILVHTTGEKTNPVPIELSIQEHLIVKRAVVIGHQRLCCSALIELDSEEASQHEPHSIEEQVFTAVKAANKDAPTHSHIALALIKILPMDKYLPTTGKGNEIKEEPLPRQAEIALAQGYGQAKYAGEHMCLAAMDLWGVPVDIYRYGQISGDSKTGVWNTAEMIPLMICAGGGELGVLPDDCQQVDWIPVNYAAACIADIVMNTTTEMASPVERVHHILNPHVISWSELLEYLQSSGLQFKVISTKEWLRMILDSPKNPVYALASFFEKMFAKGKNMEFAKFSMEKTSRRTTMLERCPPIDQKLIQHYLKYWWKIGFLKHGYTPNV
ncbi:unnamed protein product [Rotaria sordida]|uniref:Uncharacterized protein n=1 Tax=Rotaria sordida TaxID=392033 RepID=A0A819KRI0_9BILA|nr:unnamed protein product [Rotaria sordida]